MAAQEWAVSALRASPEVQAALDVADATSAAERIWDNPPPSDARLPYLYVFTSDPIDQGGVGMAEVMATTELTVQVIDQADGYEALQPLATALHQTLHGALNVPLNGGGWMLSSRRVRQVAYPERTDGIQYRHLGGTYQVTVQ